MPSRRGGRCGCCPGSSDLDRTVDFCITIVEPTTLLLSNEIILPCPLLFNECSSIDVVTSVVFVQGGGRMECRGWDAGTSDGWKASECCEVSSSRNVNGDRLGRERGMSTSGCS